MNKDNTKYVEYKKYKKVYKIYTNIDSFRRLKPSMTISTGINLLPGKEYGYKS